MCRVEMAKSENVKWTDETVWSGSDNIFKKHSLQKLQIKCCAVMK